MSSSDEIKEDCGAVVNRGDVPAYVAAIESLEGNIEDRDLEAFEKLHDPLRIQKLTEPHYLGNS